MGAQGYTLTCVINQFSPPPIQPLHSKGLVLPNALILLLN